MSRAIQPPLLGETTAKVRHVFGASPFQTDGDLLALAFAADGSLWSLEEPGVLRQWDPTEQKQRNWYDLEELATLWCFGPGDWLLASSSDDLVVWDTATGEVLAARPQPSWVTALAFHPEERLIVSGCDDGIVRLWEWPTLRLVCELPGAAPTSALAFRPDGAVLAVAAEDKIIRLFDVASGAETGRLIGHTDRIPALAWQPDGARLVSAGWDTTARVWDVKTCEPIVLLNSHTGQVHAVTYSPDGGLLAWATPRTPSTSGTRGSFRPVQVLRRQGGEVRCMAFSPDGTRLAAGGAERAIHLCDPRLGDGDGRPVDPQQSRSALTQTHGGTRLVSVGPATGIRVWDVDTGKSLVPTQVAGPLRAFAASPSGRWFVASLGERQQERKGPAWLLMLDAETGKRVKMLEGSSTPVNALAFAPDSDGFASGGLESSDVWLWSVATGEPTLILPDAADGCSVEHLLFHPQGRLLAVAGVDWLATGGNDGRISVWDVGERRLQQSLPGGAVALAFHPNGRLLAAASLVKTVRIWDLETGKITVELEEHLDAVTCVAYSADGRRLASGGDDHAVRLWDAHSGEALGEVELDTQIKAVAFSPDGRFLYTGNANASCYQLEVQPILEA